ncbi:MAG: BREX-2 system phosphatase PglZ [Polyangiales bacterium]
MRSDAVLLLKKLVEQAGGPLERGYVLAIDGEGLGNLPETISTSLANYHVNRPRTELELRRLLWKSNGAPFIALVPEELARRLPPDLVRRAQGARVQALEAVDVLSTVLGIRLTGNDDEELLALALQHIDAVKQEISERTLPTVIDRRLLDELVVDACVGKRVRTEPPASLLAGWLRSPPALDATVLRLLRRTLPMLHGTEGKLLAWALEASARLGEILVCGLLLGVSSDVPESAWGALVWAPNNPQINLSSRVLRETVVRLAERTVDALGDDAAPWLRQAEERGRKLLPPSLLAQSSLLPLGLENACAEVVRRIENGESVSDAEIAPLRAHRAASSRRGELAVLAEMARLGRFLATHDEEPSTVRAHVKRYLREGAFADVAAARLRRLLAASVEYQHAADRLLSRYRARRDAWNDTFARTLAGGYQRALHAEGVIPLHRVWRDLALPRLDAKPQGLYLIVLDGCSYPVFLELLDELASSVRPIGLTVDDAGAAMGVPSLAPLPTITSHARGAIFLGEVPNDAWAAETLWRDTEERVTDPARFRQNPSLGARPRKLFLKGDLADGGRALRESLADASVEIVAAVFNAVDDQIGSSNTGAMVKVEAAAIGGLLPSLREAFLAKRRVLVVADHGHSPWWSKDLRVGNGATPRFKELGPGEDVPDGWIEIDLQGIGNQGGRRAFAWRMGSHHGAPQVGFHGGCALEEMVVPMAWLQEDGLRADEPAWWYGQRVSLPAAAPSRKDKAPASPVRVPVATKQTELFATTGAAAPRASDLSRLGLPEAVLSTLDEFEQLALATLAQNGTVRARDLAKAVQKTVARIDGFMTRLGRKLHGTGHDLFRAQALPDGETQYTFVGPTASRAP